MARQRQKGRDVNKKILLHTELDVYRKAFDLSMQVFKLANAFPKEEMYSLVAMINHPENWTL